MSTRRLSLAFLAFFAMAVDAATGHEHWMSRSGYVSPKGLEWCCSERDCQLVDPGEVTTTSAGFLLSDGELIPYGVALQSEDNHYWRCRSPGRPTRCFFYPPPGT